METIKYNIEDQEKEFISGLVNNIKDNEARKILFAKFLAVEKLKQYFNKKGVILNNKESSLFYNYQLLKFVDITDIRINEVLIDLRIITAKEYPQLWIPKLHKDLNITPDIYIAVKLSPELTDVEFLGFTKNSDINTSCSNSKYIITDVNKLKSLEEIFSSISQFIKPRILFMDHEHEKAQELFLPLVEGELNQSNLAFLLKHLLVCEECRKLFKDFCTFDDFFLQMELDKRDIQDLTLEIFTDNSILQGEEVQINTREVECQPGIEVVNAVNNEMPEENEEKKTLFSKLKKMFLKKPLNTESSEELMVNSPENLQLDDISNQENSDELSNEESIACADKIEQCQSIALDSIEAKTEDSFEINDSFALEDISEIEKEEEKNIFDNSLLDIDSDKSNKIDDLISHFKSMENTEESSGFLGESLDLEKAIDELNTLEEINNNEFELIEVSSKLQAEENKEEVVEPEYKDNIDSENFDTVEYTEESSLNEAEENNNESDRVEFVDVVETLNEEDKSEENILELESKDNTEDEGFEVLADLEELSLSESEENNNESNSDLLGLNSNADFLKNAIAQMKEHTQNEAPINHTSAEQANSLENTEDNDCDNNVSDDPKEEYHNNQGLLDLDEDKAKELDDLITQFKSLDGISEEDSTQELTEKTSEEVSEEKFESKEQEESHNLNLSDDFEELSPLDEINLDETQEAASDPLGLDTKSALLKEAIANMKEEENNNEDPASQMPDGQLSAEKNTELNDFEIDTEQPFEISDSFEIKDSFSVDNNNESGVMNWQNDKDNKGLLDINEDKSKDLDDLISQFKSLNNNALHQPEEEHEELVSSIDDNKDLSSTDEADGKTSPEENLFVYNSIKELKNKKRYKFIKRYIKAKRAFKKLVTLMLKEVPLKSAKGTAIVNDIADALKEEPATQENIVESDIESSRAKTSVELHERQTVKLKNKSNGPSIAKIAIFLAAAGTLSYVLMDNYPNIVDQFKKANLNKNSKNGALAKKQQKSSELTKTNTEKKEIQLKKTVPLNLVKTEKIKNKAAEVPVSLTKKQVKLHKAIVKPEKQTNLVNTKNNRTTIKKQKSINNVLSSAFTNGYSKSGNSKIKISKVAWEIGASLAKDRSLKNYLVLTGNAFKTYLSDDLLWANDRASSDKVKIKVKIDLDGNLKSSKVIKSSGSKQIDEIMLKSLNKTFNYMKLPKVNTNKEYINANIVINL